VGWFLNLHFKEKSNLFEKIENNLHKYRKY
jgi:hypothetical protein